jgi:hypothetical protein
LNGLDNFWRDEKGILFVERMLMTYHLECY